MDESFAMLAIGPFEVKFTPFSRRAVMQDTGCSGLRVPFVSIHGDLLFRPLDIVGRNYQFLRKRIVGDNRHTIRYLPFSGSAYPGGFQNL